MARIYAPLVRQASSTTGTGAYTVSGAVTGHEPFSARCTTGDVFRYVARAVDGSGNPTGAYEVGTGTYSSANTITRTAILYSSNAGAAVNWSAGTKYIDIISWVDAILGQNVDSLDPVVVTATKPSPVDADRLIMLDSAAADAPVLVTKVQLLAAVNAAIVSLGDRVTALEGAPTVPAAFTVGQWTVTATGASGAVSINLTALPSNGGSAITALEYRIGAGAAVALSGTGTGARTVTGLTNDVSVNIQVRAVNTVGNGAWSDTKAVTPTITATAPAAFTVGQWTLTAGDTLLVANLTALPSDGGSAITALQYRLDGGTAVAFSGTGTGSRNITGLTNATAYNVEIRAVNSVGNGPWSDLKSATPAAAGGSAVWESVATTSGNIGTPGTTPTRPSGIVSTDLLVLVMTNVTAANIAALTVPSGWTFRGAVYSEIIGLGHAIYTASGSVADAVWAATSGASVEFDLHRISGANLTTPIRSFTDRTTVTWTPVSAANMPSPAATATAGDMVFAHYHQPQSATAVGSPTAGYTRRVDASVAGRRSTLTRANVSAGTTGEISHNASGAWEGRTSSTTLIAAA